MSTDEHCRHMFRVTDTNGHLLPDVLENPYPFYSALRSAAEPAVHLQDLSGWVISRFDSVRAAALDPRFTSQRTQAYLSELPKVDRDRFRAFAAAREDMLLFSDGPKHSRLRPVVAESLRSSFRRSPTTVQALAQEMVDALPPNGTIELMSSLALPLPIATLLELLGIPRNHARQLGDWATTFNLAIGGVIRPELVAAANQAVEELTAFLSATPGNATSILARLRAAESLGHLSAAEAVASSLMLVTAGHETAANMIGNAVFSLCRNPEQLQWLREDQRRIPAALDELLRHDAPVQLTARVATQPIALGANVVDEGDRVVLLWGSANHDERLFDAASKLDFQRATSHRHLGFGAGRHRCLGAPLARVECAAVLTSLLNRFKTIELTGNHVRRENFSFRGFERLNVVVEAF